MPTDGGAMAGYWRIGRFSTDTVPAIMTMIAITQAKMGRSMKNRESMASSSALRDFFRGVGLHRGVDGASRGHGLHFGAGLRLLHAIDDDAITRGESRRDQPVVADRSVGRDDLHRHLVVGSDD